MSRPPAPVLYPAQGTQGPVLYLNPYTGTYTASRSYGLRMQRGYAAGVPQTVARRGDTGPLSETEKRRLNFLQRWGFEEALWRRWWKKYIKEINELDPNAPITKEIVRQVLANTPITGLGADWLDNRLREKLEAMKEYRDLGYTHDSRIESGPGTEGYEHYWQETSERMVTPIELWWYH